MQPSWPFLAESAIILGFLEKTAGAKFDAENAHRAALVLPGEQGPVTIMGPNGMFYTYNVGSSGVVSDGQNLDGVASDAHCFAMSSVWIGQFPLWLFLDDALVPDGDEICEEYFFLVSFPCGPYDIP